MEAIKAKTASVEQHNMDNTPLKAKSNMWEKFVVMTEKNVICGTAAYK